ncbi:hypothetical protein D8L93_06565, partial [Sodalis-like symbiont of Bactericera trigonica]
MRGWFFDLFPQLAAFERERHHARDAIEAALTATGFELRPTTTLWETRRVYADSAALAADLRGRRRNSRLWKTTAGLFVGRENRTLLAQRPPTLCRRNSDWGAPAPGFVRPCRKHYTACRAVRDTNAR